jgi:exopolysaccharide production protein ExoZ
LENRQFLNHIESIRGTAALAVCLYHFTNFYGESTFLLNESSRGMFKFGAQAVEIFYIVSGFIIPYAFYKGRYKIKNYFKYLAKRTFRLIPPYLITIALIILVSWYITTQVWIGDYNIEWRNVGANAFFIVDLIQHNAELLAHFPDNAWINPVFRTLKVEFQFYIIIGLLFPLINRHTAFLLGITVIMLALGIYAIPHNNVFVYAPSFLIGIAAFYIFEKGWNWVYATMLGLCLLSLANFYILPDLITGIAGFAALLWLPRKMKFLKLTGKISYSFYLIHGLIGGNFLYFNVDSYLFQNYPYLMVIFALLLSWIGAFLIYFCIEKPSIRISKKIRYKS